MTIPGSAQALRYSASCVHCKTPVLERVRSFAPADEEMLRVHVQACRATDEMMSGAWLEHYSVAVI